MHYTILIYQKPEDAAQCATSPERAEDWPRYSKALKAAGIFVDGVGLQPTDTATRLSFEGGRRRVQDGPYADTKEQLGGFIIIDVPDLDTALAWAERIPHAAERVFEVRPNAVLPK